MFNTIIKRDGRTAAYDVEKIARAIFRAATSVGGKDYQTAYRLALQVQQRLEEKYPPSHLPTVEQIQDMVEKVLIGKRTFPHCQRIYPLPRTAHPCAGDEHRPDEGV